MNRTATLTHTELTLGQRVVVMEPGTWLHRHEGVIVALPSDLLGLVAVQLDGNTPLGSSPTRWLDPRRVAPASTCETCVEGCDCDGSPEHPGCGHWACWGPATVTTALPRCPGVAAQRAQSEAYKFARGWL